MRAMRSKGQGLQGVARGERILASRLRVVTILHLNLGRFGFARASNRRRWSRIPAEALPQVSKSARRGPPGCNSGFACANYKPDLRPVNNPPRRDRTKQKSSGSLPVPTTLSQTAIPPRTTTALWKMVSSQLQNARRGPPPAGMFHGFREVEPFVTKPSAAPPLQALWDLGALPSSAFASSTLRGALATRCRTLAEHCNVHSRGCGF